MDRKQYYKYDSQTKEFLGAGWAGLDPVAKLKGRTSFMLPANTTLIAPPPAKDGYVFVFSEVAGWNSVQDFRGKTLYKNDGTPVVVDKLSTDISGLIKEKPIDGLIQPKWEDGEWIEDKDVKELKKEIISKIKVSASEYLSGTDWMVTRNREQKESGTTPSLNDAEYKDLIKRRQTARDWSNTTESKVNSLKSVSGLLKIKTDFVE